jgi:hypothetical protein
MNMLRVLNVNLIIPHENKQERKEDLDKIKSPEDKGLRFQQTAGSLEHHQKTQLLDSNFSLSFSLRLLFLSSISNYYYFF